MKKTILLLAVVCSTLLGPCEKDSKMEVLEDAAYESIINSAEE